MLNRVAAVLFCLGCLTNLEAAEPVPAMIAPLAKESLLLDIATLPGDGLVVVGERGHVLVSDQGKTWSQVDVPLNSTLTAVYFINDKLGWAVGHDSSIIASEDGGQSWVVQQYKPESEKPLLDVYFKDANQGIAIGAYGLFYRTQDGGKSWQAEFHDEFLHPDDRDYLLELKEEDEEAYLDEMTSILPHFNRIADIGQGKLLLAGEAGLAALSEDFGQTWQRIDEFYLGSFYDGARLNDGRLILVGMRGHIFTSGDEGKSWQQMASGTQASLNSVLVSGERAYILGNSGVVLDLYQGQAKMHLQPDGKALLNAVAKDTHLWAATEVGVKQLEVNNE